MSNKRILMVDDDTDVNTTIRTVLEANGFNVDSYEDPLLDKTVKICFLTAGEMYYGAYDDIFSSLDAKCLIRKPIENGQLIERINEIIRPISTTERFSIDEA